MFLSKIHSTFSCFDLHLLLRNWLCKKDTKHKNLWELLDAESFGAFPSGFASVACLRERERQTQISQ